MNFSMNGFRLFFLFFRISGYSICVGSSVYFRYLDSIGRVQLTYHPNPIGWRTASVASVQAYRRSPVSPTDRRRRRPDWPPILAAAVRDDWRARGRGCDWSSPPPWWRSWPANCRRPSNSWSLNRVQYCMNNPFKDNHDFTQA